MTGSDPRAALRARAAELDALLARLDADESAVRADRADATADDEHDPEGATIAYERRLLDALTHDQRDRLREIDEAERRLAAGTYGTCARCHRPIPVERLRAVPTARTCVACAGR